LERVGWTFWRCFGSNWSLDREAVLDDLIETLRRNNIHPIGAVSASTEYTEHRKTRGSADDAFAETRLGSIVSSDPSGLSQPSVSADTQLAPGDRVMVRYLDDPKSRPLCYVLAERSDDRLNGYLSLSSPLAKVLSEAAPGDEIVANDGLADRPMLYVSLEREPARLLRDAAARQTSTST
jgi:transcription elongation GreA/GreB family factor